MSSIDLKINHILEKQLAFCLNVHISPSGHRSPENNSQPQILRLRNMVYQLFTLGKQSYNCHLVETPKTLEAVFVASLLLVALLAYLP